MINIDLSKCDWTYGKTLKKFLEVFSYTVRVVQIKTDWNEHINSSIKLNASSFANIFHR